MVFLNIQAAVLLFALCSLLGIGFCVVCPPDLLNRRQIWEVMPWDPGAWLVVQAETSGIFKVWAETCDD